LKILPENLDFPARSKIADMSKSGEWWKPVMLIRNFDQKPPDLAENFSDNFSKMSIIHHNRDSIRPKDNITMPSLSRFYSIWNYGLVGIC